MGQKSIERLVNKKELLQILSIGSSTLERLQQKGLPYYKVGSCLRFRMSEVEAWLKERKVVNG